MILTPEEAAKLNKIWNLSQELYSLIEDLRPGGGFKENIDKKFCKECGELKVKTF